MPSKWQLKLGMNGLKVLSMSEYQDLVSYFKDHPDEEQEFIDEMARLDEENFVEFPEDFDYGCTVNSVYIPNFSNCSERWEAIVDAIA